MARTLWAFLRPWTLKTLHVNEQCYYTVLGKKSTKFFVRWKKPAKQKTMTSRKRNSLRTFNHNRTSSMNDIFFAPRNRTPTKHLINITHVWNIWRQPVGLLTTRLKSNHKSSFIVSLRRQALQRPTQTSKELLYYDRALETSEYHALGIETTDHETTNKIEYQPKHQSMNRRSTPQRETHSSNNQRQAKRTTTCYNCGGTFPHPKEKPCPAKGKTCHACNKQNHFAKYCKSTSQPRQTRKRIDQSNQASKATY